MTAHPDCTCPHAEQSLGRLYGVGMGRGIVRVSTKPGCPIHAECSECGMDEWACYKKRESKGYGKDLRWLKSPCCPNCSHLRRAG